MTIDDGSRPTQSEKWAMHFLGRRMLVIEDSLTG